MSRETIMVSLFNVLSAATLSDNVTPAFIMTSRRMKLWGDVDNSQKPALFLMESHETRTQQPPQGLTSKLLMKAAAFIYTSAPEGSTVVPSTVMNACIDAIEKALLPDDVNRNVFTLGGTVYRCWVEGSILKVPGDLDGQGLAMVPINILVP